MADNNGWNDWGSSDDFNEGQEQEVEQPLQKPAKVDVKPVSLPKKIIMFLLIGVCVAVIVVTILASNASVEKEVNQDDYYQSELMADDEYNQTDPNGVEGEPNLSENLPDSGEVSSSLPQDVNGGNPSDNSSVDIPQGNEEQHTPGENGNPYEDLRDTEKFTAVNEPILGEEQETTGMVLTKGVYRKGTTYIYNIQLSIVYGELAQTVDYFCPKGTYDALSSGDIVNVIYAMDGAGNFSVTSIYN